MSGLTAGEEASMPMAAASSPEASMSIICFPFSIGTTFGGGRYFRHVLVAREHPGDLAQIDAVLRLQDAARPYAGRNGVAAVDADFAPFEVLGRADAGIGADGNGAVMERAHQKDRHRGHALAMRLRADVGRDGHLADVELEPADHAAECSDQRIDLDELEGEGFRLDAAVLQRLVVALGAGDGSHVRYQLSGIRYQEAGEIIDVVSI